VNDLVEFLRARLDDADRVVYTREALVHSLDCEGFTDEPPGAEAGVCSCGGQSLAQRDIATKQQILNQHQQTAPGWCGICDIPAHVKGNEHGCLTVRLLAGLFVSHPDYRQEWRP
jgi:hypothetical protein